MIANEIIMASAGSGKTFALTSRLIRLLASGVRPERIAALTFSRAAAGEILDELVGRLAAAASSPEGADQEASSNLRMPGLGQGRFATLLVELIASMHRLPIGTLDSFFVGVLRRFPFEFGLNGDFAILDEHALSMEKERIFRRLLLPPAADGVAQAQREFLEAFKRATFGQEEKRLRDHLHEFTDAHYSLYLAAQDAALWGNEAVIWPHGQPWTMLEPTALKAQAEAFAAGLRRQGLPESVQTRWDAFVEMASTFSPTSVLGEPGKGIFEKLVQSGEDLRSESASFAFFAQGPETGGRKKKVKVELAADLCRSALSLTGHVAACILANRLESTRGIHAILDRYDEAYSSLVRGTGRLTFGDVVHLLAAGTDAAGEPVLTREHSASPDRLYIDYRLDGAYDHWAIDEFQDTSRRQWSAIRNLIDEAVQDVSGSRSFFAVGDAKQAIYGWRGGDSSLLEEICGTYGIAPSPLAKSWRSCGSVIRMVNGVFGNLESVPDLPREAVIDRWNSLWCPHRTVHEDQSGFAAVLEPPPPDDPEDDPMAAAAVSLLHEIEPWSHGLTAAVLVRSNRAGAELAERLRACGVPAVWQGDRAIVDNPVVSAILALLRVAEHPGDVLAWQHVLMTPLGDCLGSGGRRPSRSAVARAVLHSIHTRGFAETIEHWVTKLAERVRLDPFTTGRTEQMLAAAALFDAQANRSALDFSLFVESYTASDTPAAETVRVMTIHRSKGLGFDVVVLPLERGRSGLTTLTVKEVEVDMAEDLQAPRWILQMPPKEIALTDPVLRARLEARMHQTCFEELCILYVAMTRAKRGLYVVLPPVAKSSKALHVHTLLRQALAESQDQAGAAVAGGVACLACFGEPGWFEASDAVGQEEGVEGDATTGPEHGVAHPDGPRRVRPPRRLPSQHDDSDFAAGSLFAEQTRRGRELGTAVHGLLEQIRWLEDPPFDTAVLRWRERYAPSRRLTEEACAAVRTALGDGDIRALLTPSRDAHVSLWREKSFELLLDGEWLSGTFDRVVIRRQPDGKPGAATIIDYKSDRVVADEELASAVGHYRPQLALYRRALSKLLGLPAECIDTVLVFTHCARVVRL